MLILFWNYINITNLPSPFNQPQFSSYAPVTSGREMKNPQKKIMTKLNEFGEMKLQVIKDMKHIILNTC